MNYFWIENLVGDVRSYQDLTHPEGNFKVIDCKRAIFHRRQRIAEDWHIDGPNRGGVGFDVLWLYGLRQRGSFTPMAAWTELSKPSSAIAFVMGGDNTDGYAEFIVDETSIGSFNLYRDYERNQDFHDPNNPNRETKIALVVYNLPDVQHKLTVRLTGEKIPESRGRDAHIYGGLALLPHTFA